MSSRDIRQNILQNMSTTFSWCLGIPNANRIQINI